MLIKATLRSSASGHDASVATAGAVKQVAVPPKRDGQGSSINGGEFLMLALATCYCNDIYREAARLNIRVDAVEVHASAEFEGVGLAAKNIRYQARVSSPAPAGRVAQLLRETDAVAEIHNTVRAGVPVMLIPWDAKG